ncbi:hypothetical protein D3C74_483920 [compost metagenome]
MKQIGLEQRRIMHRQRQHGVIDQHIMMTLFQNVQLIAVMVMNIRHPVPGVMLPVFNEK